MPARRALTAACAIGLCTAGGLPAVALTTITIQGQIDFVDPAADPNLRRVRILNR